MSEMSRYHWMVIAALFASASPACAESKLMTLLDMNKDGAVELCETRVAASASFERIIREGPVGLVSQVSQERFKRKFLAAVDKWFKAADADGNGRLDESELQLPAGQKLEKLLSR